MPAPDVAVVDSLRTVAVRVEQERAVVVLPVMRPRAGHAVVSMPGVCTDAPELVHELLRRRGESNMEVSRDWIVAVGRGERELSLPDGVFLVTAAPPDPDRLQHGVVDRLRRLAVGRADRDVVEHSGTIPAVSRARPWTWLQIRVTYR